MRVQGLLAPVALALALLTGCTGAAPYAFLDEESVGGHAIDAATLTQSGIDPDSIRFQGTWEDHELFLALVPTEPLDGVALVVVPGDAPDQWVVGSTTGDSRIGVTGPSGFEAQYEPSGIGDPPEGWVAVSEWVMVRE